MLKELYHEQVVNRRKSKSDKLLLVLFLVVLAVFLLLGTLFLGVLAYILAALVVVLFFFVLSGIPIAYEYAMTNNILRVDAVYKQRKRREMLEFDVRACEVVARQNDEVLNGIKPRHFYLYHSEEKEEIPYAVIFTDQDGLNCVLLNLDAEMLSMFGRYLGPKVHVS